MLGEGISIHALCEEGDRASSWMQWVPPYFYPRPLRGGRPGIIMDAVGSAIFLSTPSARRATGFVDLSGYVEKISIHALCEEGDGTMQIAKEA